MPRARRFVLRIPAWGSPRTSQPMTSSCSTDPALPMPLTSPATATAFRHLGLQPPQAGDLLDGI